MTEPRDWIQAKDPRLTGEPYGALTPHQFKPANSGLIHHSGMAVAIPIAHSIMNPGVIMPNRQSIKNRIQKAPGITFRAIAIRLNRGFRTLTDAFDGAPILQESEINTMIRMLESAEKC